MILSESSKMHQTAIVHFDQSFAPIIKSIRLAVFTEEQGVPEELDLDGNDSDAVHVLVSTDGRYVGTGRMLSDGHIGRVAVLEPYRQKGIGKKVILALIEQAVLVGMRRVFLGAQLTVKPFYEKLGFLAYGDIFLDADIKHIHMERFISNEHRTK